MIQTLYPAAGELPGADAFVHVAGGGGAAERSFALAGAQAGVHAPRPHDGLRRPRTLAVL